jgi:signal transduction histidine kinase
VSRAETPDDLFRRQMLRHLSLAFAVVAGVAAFARHLVEPVTQPLGPLMIAGCTSLFLVSAVLCRRQGGLTPAVVALLAGIAAFLANAVIFSGGLTAPAIGLIQLLPVLAFCFAGGAAGLITTGAAIAAIGILVALENTGHISSTITFARYADAKAVGLTALCLISGFIGSTFHRARRIAEHRLVEMSRIASLGTMAGGIAHEINNPLAIIGGLAEHIERTAKDPALDREQLTAEAAKIQATVRRISTIITGLRSYSRDDSHDPMQRIPIKDVIESTLSLCRERFRANGVTLEVPAVDAGLWVMGRSVQLSQVLLNLLNNAFDAVASLPAGRERSVIIKADRRGRDLVVQVSDSGPGVAPDARAKVFSPFFTTKEVGKGVGLGLSISARIVHGHGGELSLAEGLPTTFRVQLPLAT